MNDPVPNESLHPNIARMAAAYDQVIAQMSRGQLTGAQARAKIDQLEARDDQGVRWSVDPDTGQYVRKTLMGDTQYDTPPVVGYQTPDAFSYSATSGTAIDPNLNLELYAAAPEPPANLAGATRNGPHTAAPASPALASLTAGWGKVPPVGRLLLAAAAAVALLLLLFG